MDSLKDKTLIMLVGPSAIGKSTLMNEVIRQSSDFARVSGFTTRSPRANDESGLYRYLSDSEASGLIERQAVVQFAKHPTTGVIYGSQASDYPAAYNLLDTLANVVDSLRTLPFKQTVTISLTAPADEWKHWFLSRYPMPSDEAEKRLHEAEQSIEWSLQDPETYWLENPANQIEQTASKLIDIVLERPVREIAREPQAMLEIIRKGIWS